MGWVDETGRGGRTAYVAMRVLRGLCPAWRSHALGRALAHDTLRDLNDLGVVLHQRGSCDDDRKQSLMSPTSPREGGGAGTALFVFIGFGFMRTPTRSVSMQFVGCFGVPCQGPQA